MCSRISRILGLLTVAGLGLLAGCIDVTATATATANGGNTGGTNGSGPCATGVTPKVQVTPDTVILAPGASRQAVATFTCTGEISWLSNNVSVAAVNQSGVITGVSQGNTWVYAFVILSGVKYQDSVYVTVTPPSPVPSVSITVTNPNMSYSTCNTWSSPTFYTVTSVGGADPSVAVTSTGHVATVSSGQLVLRNPAVAGVDTVTVTSNFNQKVVGIAYLTVTVCPPVQTAISVALAPATFSLIVGGQPVVLTATTNDLLGVTFSTNKAGCVQLAVNGNTVSVSAITACTGVTVTATSKTDTTKSASSNGAVGSGTISCTFTSNVGMQANGSIILTVNQTAILTGSCTNQFGVTFIPYWYSSNPASVDVNGATTTVVISGFTYPAGPQATIKGIASGSATVTMQAAVTDQTILFQRSVIIQ